MLDLFCGLGGFSQAFRERGHRVVGIDIVPPADIVADLLIDLPLRDFQPDVILASPPCTEFSKWAMPWHPDVPPDMRLVERAFAIVDEMEPRWWVVENVAGALDWFPRRPTYRFGSRVLWGRMPFGVHVPRSACHGKERLGPQVENRSRIRSKIPYEISLALCRAMEGAWASLPA